MSGRPLFEKLMGLALSPVPMAFFLDRVVTDMKKIQIQNRQPTR